MRCHVANFIFQIAHQFHVNSSQQLHFFLPALLLPIRPSGTGAIFSFLHRVPFFSFAQSFQNLRTDTEVWWHGVVCCVVVLLKLSFIFMFSQPQIIYANVHSYFCDIIQVESFEGSERPYSEFFDRILI